jgi:hypothetical protein
MYDYAIQIIQNTLSNLHINAQIKQLEHFTIIYNVRRRQASSQSFYLHSPSRLLLLASLAILVGFPRRAHEVDHRHFT